MRIPIYQLDAFTTRVFHGNPAAVCMLDEWLPAPVMQSIAAENNLAETAFCVAEGDSFAIRWFTPTIEMDLAGHPTLATAWVILNLLEPGRRSVRFRTGIGDTLDVVRDGERLAMNFPARPPVSRPGLDGVGAALGATPLEVLAARDGFAVYETEAQVRALAPDMDRVAAIDVLGVIATAPGSDCDFVSRFFGPGAGVPEDPATGSAHCTLIPYWAERLGKDVLFGRQVSPRGGEFYGRNLPGRVEIAGHVVLYMRGTITV